MKKWSTAPLADVADFRLGKMLDQKKNRGEFLPYLANVNVRWGSFDLDDLREMRFEHHEMDTYGLKYGDIVMCEGGEPGRCAIWKQQGSTMMIQKALHRIRPYDCLDSRFLFYFFLNIGRKGGLSPLFTGATIKHLPKEKLAKVEVSFPSIPEQKYIADLLVNYDEHIENNRRRIELLEQSARLLYKEWFIHLRFPGHEHVKIVDGVPEGWKRNKLGDIVSIKKGKNITNAESRNGDIPVVAGGLLPAYYHDTPNVVGPVITISASGANAGFVNLYNQDVWASDCSYIGSRMTKNLYFFYLFLQEKRNEIFSMQKGAAQPHVYPKDLQRLEGIFPATGILDLFEDTVSLSFKQIGILQKQSAVLANARDLFLPRLMNGELVA